IAGGTWIAIRRQLPSSSRRPPKSSATPPTASASGASKRWRRLCSSTARAIASSSPSRTARPIAARRSAHSRVVTSGFDRRARLAVARADRGGADAEDDHQDDQRAEDRLRPLVGLVQLPGLLDPDQRRADRDVEPGVEDVFDGQQGEPIPRLHRLADLAAVVALAPPAQVPPDRRQQEPPLRDRLRFGDL